MKTVCPKCQTNNAEDSQFCSQCGARLLSEMDSTISFTGLVEVAEEEPIDFEKLGDEGPLLIVVKGIGVGQTFSVSKNELKIGRDPDNDIFLDDITVSRKHALIKHKKGNLVISDVGSLNGTYLNHERVDEAYLDNKDEIQIGKFKMIYIDKSGAKNGA